MNTRPYLQTTRTLSDRSLLKAVRRITGKSREILAWLLAHLCEIDARRLYCEEACSSLFMYLTDRLQFSESEAYRRMATAQVARTYPVILDRIAGGEIHMTGVLLLKDHLTPENHRELLDASRHKTKREIEKLIAERFPLPDAKTVTRKLPSSRRSSEGTSALFDDADTEAARALPIPPRQETRGSIQPTSATRHKVQFAAGDEFMAWLEKAKALLWHTIPDGDLETVMTHILKEFCVKAEQRKFGMMKQRAPKEEKSERESPS
ncbi:MAG TPA: hypothetical protein VJ837_02490, partial [Candidatus Paceibacterota bacterium]|nr:hypothetical protein [Candidatus Paceibacterota bacterium]